uniref:Uncharacterized protein n=1 Tax=Rhizophora mucronata TaxID=61149 RepID=A0A2P2PXN2_RHIMU
MIGGNCNEFLIKQTSFSWVPSLKLGNQFISIHLRSPNSSTTSQHCIAGHSFGNFFNVSMHTREAGQSKIFRAQL